MGRAVGMGLVASALRMPTIKAAATIWQPAPNWQINRAQMSDTRYQTYAREGYMANELVFACIEELSTSAAEPSMHARLGTTWTTTHPILDLLNKPNPFMDRFEFWATVIMHLSIAGNAYALKIRSGSMKVVQLWLIRPDRVRIVPINGGFDRRYDIDIGGGEFVPIQSKDLIHFKRRHPLDDLYGMPPLMPISGRVDIDNYMRDFVKTFFLNAGVPGGVLSIEGDVDDDEKEMIRNRFKSTVGGPAHWHDLLILDNSKATFTPMTAQLGSRGLVIPDLDEIAEARTPMVFGVPQSLIGTRTSYANGGYANKRAEKTEFWDNTLSPMYHEMVGPLNMNLVPDFTRVDEIAFDLSQVRALQEDIDKVHARIRADYEAGLIPLETAQNRLEIAPSERSGMYLVPMSVVPTPSKVLDAALAAGEQVPPPRLTERSGESGDPGVDGGKPAPAEPAGTGGGN